MKIYINISKAFPQICIASFAFSFTVSQNCTCVRLPCTYVIIANCVEARTMHIFKYPGQIYECASHRHNIFISDCKENV